MRIHSTNILFDAARELSEMGYCIKPQWGPLFTVLGIALTAVALRLNTCKKIG